ncbi:large ribosomal subunit protein uL22-like [Zophobas morio]|uniref:large ribosomal subunit protein uL22-like n=1 Tax=Zophobas morio TaxID=2755281 RepID=UPI00308345CF
MFCNFFEVGFQRSKVVTPSLSLNIVRCLHYPRVALPGIIKDPEPEFEKPVPNTYSTKLLNLKGGYRKLNYCAKQVRRSKVDDAIIQMDFSPKLAADNVKRILYNVRRKARDKGNTNELYISKCWVGKAQYTKSIDYKARGRCGYKFGYYSHLFVEIQDQPLPMKSLKRRARKAFKLKQSLSPLPILFNI